MADPSQVCQLPIWFEAISKLAIPSIAIVGAIYTALQFQRAKRWRAGDLAITLIAQLETDEELAFACRAIDWGLGPLVVPERYRPLVENVPAGKKDPNPTERGEVVLQEPDLMWRALRVYLAISPKTEPTGLIYRYCFDKLFNHLANVHRLLMEKQVELNDLERLKYWLERIAAYEYCPPGKEKHEMFQPFLEFEPFGYRGVIDLGEQLGVGGWVKAWQAPTSLRPSTDNGTSF
ncbi:hypothetical protein [Nitrobacter sp. JJSN]|uniref:hypothetical protein n=1 Tax=Nitrobacter sp. JJSN TaxID=3453033 RepID=UPI003F773754